MAVGNNNFLRNIIIVIASLTIGNACATTESTY